jgi:hypothetical protein
VYPPGGAQGVHPGELGRPGQVDHAGNLVAEVSGGDHHGRAAHGRAHQDDPPGTVVAGPLRRGGDFARVVAVTRRAGPVPVEVEGDDAEPGGERPCIRPPLAQRAG